MVIPSIYYQYELAHFKGNMGHDATSDDHHMQTQPYANTDPHMKIFSN
jgi:hypothetical protein